MAAANSNIESMDSTTLRNRDRQSHLRSSTQLDSTPSAPSAPVESSTSGTNQKNWLSLALLSGTFAALNGVFAKLTTTSLTSHLTTLLITSLPLPSATHQFLDLFIRALFFALNIASNGVMWMLFTRALTAGSSATRVSVANSSANFMATALLGWGIFGEGLRPMWFLGAAFLVVGNVIIGRGAKGEVEKGGGDGEVKKKEL